MHVPTLSSLALALAALVAAPHASAQPAAAASAAGSGNCNPRQDPAACRRESGAAREAAREGQLTSGNAANALARCKTLPGAQQADCEARVRGGGAGTTTSSGSVMGGGVVRETVTTVPVPAPASPSK